MSHPTPGVLIDANQAKDAIHIAIAPVIATEPLKPGQHIGFVEAGCVQKVGKAGPKALPIGIVDPFLKEPVSVGDRFWMFIYPNTIQGLRHDWTHPSFHAAAVANKLNPSPAEQALRDFADEIGVNYEELIEHARLHQQTGEYWNEGGKFEGIRTPADFWRNYQQVTGEKLNNPGAGSFFSCAC